MFFQIVTEYWGFEWFLVVAELLAVNSMRKALVALERKVSVGEWSSVEKSLDPVAFSHAQEDKEDEQVTVFRLTVVVANPAGGPSEVTSDRQDTLQNGDQTLIVEIFSNHSRRYEAFGRRSTAGRNRHVFEPI